MSNPIDLILAALLDARPSGTGWTSRCPAHDDQHPSLSISEADDSRVLLHCHAGCTFEAVVDALGLTVAQLRPEEEGEGTPPPSSAATSPLTGLTLDAYSAAKALPVAFLRGLGVEQIFISSNPVVKIPYHDPSGAELSVQFRFALAGGNRFRWRKDDKPMLYGLDRLAVARESGYVVLVEGAADAQTLWLHDIPALGVPGATTWKPDWASHLNEIEVIYLVVEPDQGGEALLERLGRTGVEERLRLIRDLGAKDASDLYVRDPGAFLESWQRAVASAVAWSDEAEETAAALADAAYETAGDLIGETDILERFADLMAIHGRVVGEQAALKLLYLAVTSRLLDEPVSVVVKGPSAAGKSHLVKQVLAAFPPEAQYAVTAMSERALAYGERSLSHLMMVIYEAAGLSGEFGTYLLRSLLSEGRLAYETVERTDAGLRTRLIEREGPTGLILTTTEVNLHAENETRMLSVPVTDTQDQTRAVMLALAHRSDSTPDMAPWHALQVWLASSPTVVRIPYAGTLAELVRPVAVRLRRDFGKILSLIEAHALLHQAVRDHDAGGATIATIEDYRAVHALVADMISEGIDSAVPRSVRETVWAVEELAPRPASGEQSEQVGVTAAAIGRHLELDKSAARRRALDAVERGYLQNLETRPLRPGRFILGEPLPRDIELLPDPDRLALVSGGAVAAPVDGSDPLPAALDLAGVAQQMFPDAVFLPGTDVSEAPDGHVVNE